VVGGRALKLADGSTVRSLLAGAWRPEPLSVDCSAEELCRVAPLLASSGADALAWRRLRDTDLAGRAEAAGLRDVHRLNTLQAGRREYETRRVFTLLRTSGVEPILIKGWAVARLYPERGLRPYGDIDLCVSPADYARARATLDAPDDRNCWVDLDHDEVDRLDTRPWEELYSRSVLVRLGDEEVRVPCAEDHLRLLCIHLLKEGARRPLWLCDVALAVESRPEGFDWDLCLGESEPQANWVACTVALAGALLGARLEGTPAAGLTDRLPRWLAPSVLGQWGEPFRGAEPPIRWQLRRPAGLPRALRNRWPNPLEAMVATMSPLRDSTPLPAQLRTYFDPSRAGKLLRRA
jgi:hypothetical protein